jgi:hypothetical protein
MLNSGDQGLLRSLDALSAAAASQSAHDGATIGAHAQDVRYGLSLMNQWRPRAAIPSPMRSGTNRGSGRYLVLTTSNHWVHVSAAEQFAAAARRPAQRTRVSSVVDAAR